MTARLGAPKTGGRRRGSLDKGERQLVTAEMAADILTVYKKLGGVKWLLATAKEQPVAFIQQCLSRLLPAPQKDDPDVQINQQFNLDQNPVEAARRIAFVLASACHDDPSVAVRDITLEAVPRWQEAPPDLPPLLNPEPVEDPERARWVEELGLTEEQKRDAALIRQTQTATLANYAGSSAEQGPVSDRPAGGRKPTISEIRRRQLLS